MKCKFYNSGSALTGASCGPPDCKLGGDAVKCNNNTKACPFTKNQLLTKIHLLTKVTPYVTRSNIKAQIDKILYNK